MNTNAPSYELTVALAFVGAIAAVMIGGFAVLMTRAFWRARDYVGPKE